MSGSEELRNMVMTFRVSELQMLLGFAGRNKSGRKTELQCRALELIRLKSTPVQMKIRELYKSIQQGLASGQPPGEGGQQVVSGAAPMNINQMPIGAQQTRSLRDPMISSMASNAGSYGYAQQGVQRPLYSVNSNQMYNYTPKVTSGNPNPQVTTGAYPVHPDVRFKTLPFYDLLAELLKPSSLMPQTNQRMQEGSFVFHLTPFQATEIAMSRDIGIGNKAEYITQVQMRFCLLETSCEQEDFFPPGIIVKINGKPVTLPSLIPTNKPNVEPKRSPRPVNVTHLVRLSPTITNHVNITWAAEYGRGYAVAIYLVRKLSSLQLLQRLKTKGVRHSDYTTGLIKEKLSEDADLEIASSSLRVSLMCPLGRMRITTPSRASTCSHLQCFDANTFLNMNEKKPTWTCPVCDKPCQYDKLIIDGYFQEVLTSSRLPADAIEVQVHNDGSWSLYNVKKEAPQKLDTSMKRTNLVPTIIETIPVDEDGPPTDTEDMTGDGSSNSSCSISITTPSVAASSSVPTKEAPKRKAVVIDLTCDSDDDADSHPAKRVNNGTTSLNSPIKSDSVSCTSVYTSSNRGFSTDSCSNMSGTGRSSVTSNSGYTSPNIIMLDSPSPPPINQEPALTITPTDPISVPDPAASTTVAITTASDGTSSLVSTVVPPYYSNIQSPSSSTSTHSNPIFDLERDGWL